MQKAAGIIFFLSWLLCGCSIDGIFDDWKACIVFIMALIVCIATALVMSGED